MLPNFLIIGATTAGTTSLSTYLSRHPQVFMLIGKQLHFFADVKVWSRGSSWYASHFAASGDAIAVGQGSTDCTKYPIHQGVAERMASLLPGVELIN